MLSFRKCAMTLIPGDLFSRPHLTHHGAASDAWNVRAAGRVSTTSRRRYAIWPLARCRPPSLATCVLGSRHH
jgi:hypothetical protein